jgi:poly(3-hydroxybutyrate) depolymerase
MKYLRYPFVSLFLILLSLQASAYNKQSININVNGQQRNMVVFTPNQLPAKSPLFIVTHGMNQDPEYQYGADKMYEMIDTAKFVVTYLRSDGSTWDVGGTKDQNFVTKAIDEMASRFDIDKERVYWSGFSMGSMLIHHCIANMQDKIAAFAPTSGIQFSEQPWNNCHKPVNLIECIAYGDDVFGYEQYGIHAYIENYAKHDKHTVYRKTVGYRPANGSWYDGDLECWTGGANGGEVWLYSYNNGGHWPMDQNRHLIWNFCKRFSLNMPTVRITQPAGETSCLYMAPKDEAVFPDITVGATAKAQSGKIVKADFFDGEKLLETLTVGEDSVYGTYTATLTTPTTGHHNLRVVVTDEKGKTAEASCMVNYEAPEGNYSLNQHFNTEGIVPQDWYVSNGSTKRVGGGLPYTSGPRLLRFTNDTRDFDYGLLVQNATGKEKAAWAKYGTGAARSTMTLHAGHYNLSYRIYNWNQPEFTPVTIAIEDRDGQEVATKVYTPTKNIGGDTGNKFSGLRQQRMEFDIAETGEYVIAFYTDATRNADFVLGPVSIQAKEFHASGIKEVNNSQFQSDTVYDLNGQRMKDGQLKRGIYIKGGHKTVIQ